MRLRTKERCLAVSPLGIDCICSPSLDNQEIWTQDTFIVPDIASA